MSNFVTVYAEATPNPDSMKFVVSKMVLPNDSVDYRTKEKAEGNSPLAVAIFNEYPFANGVFIMNNFISITKLPDVQWVEHISPIREFIKNYLESDKEIISKAREIIDSMGKRTVMVKDTPGFIVNRIARPFYSEAIRLFEEGFASVAEIDQAMKVYGGFRMGPFELMDLIGHDVNYTVTETVWTAFYFDPRYTPSFTQKRLVEAKWYGRKSGRGFYDYAENAQQEEINVDEEKGKIISNRIVMMLINEAANALYLNVASKEDIDTAMTKGVNYPKGLLRWADEIGIGKCVEHLDALYNEYHEDRYRCSPLLRKMMQLKQIFYP